MVSRRAFLAGGLGLLARPRPVAGAARRSVRFESFPFSLGVASGDPSPDGMVLWTRLAPAPLIGGGMPTESVDVEWQVAEDEA